MRKDNASGAGPAAVAAPASEEELVRRAAALAGLSIAEVAQRVGFRLPPDLRRHKGVIGDLLERVLGADAGSRPLPDFVDLGIELKSIPVGRNLRPRESTHVCTVALGELAGQTWQTSAIRRKLARVLFVPVEADPDVPLARRRIGQAVLWSPAEDEDAQLRRDWEEQLELIATGQIEALSAHLGSCMQVRPKGRDRRDLVASYDADGNPAATLPRGFYLRPEFTARILARALGGRP